MGSIYYGSRSHGAAPDDASTPVPAAGYPEPTIVLPTSVAGIEFPGTRLARAAAQLAFDASPDVLYNHLMRTYVFGGLYFRSKGTAYDPELAFLGSVLHDLGLLDAFMTIEDLMMGAPFDE